MFVTRVTDAESAPEIDDPRCPPVFLATTPAERDETLYRFEAFVEARELRADVDVDAGQIEHSARARDGGKGL